MGTGQRPAGAHQKRPNRGVRKNLRKLEQVNNVGPLDAGPTEPDSMNSHSVQLKSIVPAESATRKFPNLCGSQKSLQPEVAYKHEEQGSETLEFGAPNPGSTVSVAQRGYRPEGQPHD